jgi:putative FmdB family regulatory protein
MPIYEFFCDSCNVIFNFFSQRVNTAKKPDCPRCGKLQLERRISTFATIGKAREEGGDPLAGLDETKMERAFESLMREAEHINEDDPKQMASLMRKFTSQTGINLGGSMEEALSRMEAGEDPEQVEKDMGELFDKENVSFDVVKKKVLQQTRPPIHDEKLYEL